MSKVRTKQNRDPTKFPQSGLEARLIKEFLAEKGYRMSDLKDLPDNERRDLMVAACMYAAIRLANIEARSRFVEKIELD